MNMKRCCGCKGDRPISDFYSNKSRKDGLSSDCKSCVKKYVRKYRSTDKGKFHTRKMNLRHHYGLTLKQYDQMFEDQNGVCAICGGINENGKRLYIDHNHETKKVRSLLCHVCNVYVGMVENKRLIKRINKYLKGHSD